MRRPQSSMKTGKNSQSEKPEKASFQIPPGQKKKIEDAIKLIHDTYLPALQETQHLPPEKKSAIIAANPRLNRLLQPFLEYLGAPR